MKYDCYIKFDMLSTSRKKKIAVYYYLHCYTSTFAKAMSIYNTEVTWQKNKIASYTCRIIIHGNMFKRTRQHLCSTPFTRRQFSGILALKIAPENCLPSVKAWVLSHCGGALAGLGRKKKVLKAASLGALYTMLLHHPCLLEWMGSASESPKHGRF